jgi:hypothetical protein
MSAKKRESAQERAVDQFEKEVFPAELREIARRRMELEAIRLRRIEERQHADEELSATMAVGNLPHPATGSAHAARPVRSRDYAQSRGDFGALQTPSTRHNLAGLALSGGGIRSATFNLGVVQSLAEHGVFKEIDYLSTVSGGGYLGSCLSSLLNHADAADPERFPFLERSTTGKEPPALEQLRNYSNYLAPSGLLDMLRIPALLLRGILLHVMTIFPYIVLAVWVTYWISGDWLLGLHNRRTNGVSFTLTTLALQILLAWTIVSTVGQKFRAGRFGERNAFQRSFSVLLLLFGLAATADLMPASLALYHYFVSIAPRGSTSELIRTLHQSTEWAVAASLFGALFAGKASEKVSTWRGRATLALLGVIGPLVIYLVYLRLAEWGVYALVGGPGLDTWYQLTWLAFGLFLFTFFFVDANKTSLHAFYRDRLSRAYLYNAGDPDREPRGDDLRLSDLNQPETTSPYHLINATVNLQGDADLGLHGRRSDFFFFSKHYTGGPRTGFCTTKQLESVDPHLNLGTAMSISGAAAAPNMGTSTRKSLVFIMTVLNVRLGYWLPNPRYAAQKWRGLFRYIGVGPLYLFRELFGRVTERSTFVNVSDGGHIENLGVYELLRRRCRFIIASDAEQDAGLTFGGLATVMRYAEIDLGTRIEIELGEVRRGPDGFSRKACALGKIRYPDGETGHLLYIKSCLSGAEAEYIREYRARNVDFPHESTGDQFFNESQFEAYRALGYHTATSLFAERGPMETLGGGGDVAVPGPLGLEIGKWFEDLHLALRPRFPFQEAFLDLQDRLSDIEREFADPDLNEYTYQLFPEMDPERTTDDAFAKCVDPFRKYPSQLFDGKATKDVEAALERFRKVFHVCSRQMQLMENAFLALALDDPSNRDHYYNRGWMNLFRRWSQAAYFRRTFAASIGNYSVSFQVFCKEALDLELQVNCERGEWDNLTEFEQQYLNERDLGWRVRGETREDAVPDREGTYEIWMSHARLRGDDGVRGALTFPIGCCVVRVSGRHGGPQRADLVFYRIRDYYRQMRLFEPMLRACARAVRESYPGAKLWVFFSNDMPDAERLYGYIFRATGFSTPGSDFAEANTPAMPLNLAPQPVAAN